jgi:hypothetical protein
MHTIETDGKQTKQDLTDLNAKGIFPRLRSRKAMRKEVMQAVLYNSCPCGSSRKFRFCCYLKRNKT